MDFTKDLKEENISKTAETLSSRPSAKAKWSFTKPRASAGIRRKYVRAAPPVIIIAVRLALERARKSRATASSEKTKRKTDSARATER